MTAIEPEAPTIRSWHSHAFKSIIFFMLPTLVASELANAFVGLKTIFLVKEDLHFSASSYGTLMLFLGIPSYLQPFIGAVTDLKAFFGYHRRSYYMAAKIVGAALFISLAVLETTGKVHLSPQQHLVAVVAVLLMNGICGAIRTVIFNAIVVSLGNVTGRFGQLFSFTRLLPVILGITFTARMSGIVAQNWSYAATYLAGAAITLISMPLVLFIDEIKQPAAHTLTETERTELAPSNALKHAASVKSILHALKSPSLWALVGFVFYLIVTPGIGNTKLYFEQDSLHFSKKLIGLLGMYTNFGLLFGYFAYAAVSRRLPVYMLAWTAWVVDCISYPVLLVLHGPKSAIFVEIASAIIGAVYAACLYTLAARVCPRGVEAVIYGVFSSAMAFSSQLSEKIGASIYDHFGPAAHFSLVHGWRYSCFYGFWFTVPAVILIPLLPKWTRSRKLVGELTDEDVEPTRAAAGITAVAEAPASAV